MTLLHPQRKTRLQTVMSFAPVPHSAGKSYLESVTLNRQDSSSLLQLLKRELAPLRTKDQLCSVFEIQSEIGFTYRRLFPMS